MEFCFTHFQSVSLWTAGTQEYADFIARSIAPKGYQFLFVLSRIHCKDHPAIEGTLVKDMNGISSFFAKFFFALPFRFSLIQRRPVAQRHCKDIPDHPGELAGHRRQRRLLRVQPAQRDHSQDVEVPPRRRLHLPHPHVVLREFRRRQRSQSVLGRVVSLRRGVRGILSVLYV